MDVCETKHFQVEKICFNLSLFCVLVLGLINISARANFAKDICFKKIIFYTVNMTMFTENSQA